MASWPSSNATSTLIGKLIHMLESIDEPNSLQKERIETPDWAKDTETTQSTDCPYETNTKNQDTFPFDACMSTDAFTAFLNTNADIIQKEGDVFIKNLHDKRGMNLLHCACINDCDQLIDILILQYHIDINEVDTDGYSPLFYSVNQWSEECVSKLLSHKPRLDLITKDCVIHATGFPIYICGGRTILHQSAEVNSTECCHLLLQYIAQSQPDHLIPMLFNKDFNGFTAMDTARMHNKPEMLQLFNNCIRKHTNNAEILKSLNDNIDKDESRRLKREFHLKVRDRIKQNKAKLHKQQQMNIATHYKPKFAQLFFQKKNEYFPLHMLNQTLLQLIRELNSSNDMDIKLKIIDKYSKEPINFLQNPFKGIYVFPVFSQDLCDKLLLESENYIEQSLGYKNSGLLPIARPNSMNSYGLVLNSIGMTKSWNYLIAQVVKPLADMLIPPNIYKISKFDDDDEKKECEWKFKSHHTFIIRYKEGEDVNLDTHVDASAVTFNICLGKEFEGAKVYFHAIANNEDDEEKDKEYERPHPDGNCKYCRYELVHKVGYGALHVGNYIHGATRLTKGTRSNVVIWCKEYQKSDT